MIISWIIGLARTRTLAFVGTVLGIAVTTGLVTALGAFSKLSSSEMTTHAVSTVPIDWQAEFAPDLPADGIIADMRGAARIEKAASVGYASIDGLEAATKGTVQTTGPGKILGIDPDYTANFPNNIRPLLGQISGVLIAQQTAANLHVGPGDSLTIHRPALPDIRVRIDGVVDLPNADSLFQSVGAPASGQPKAPPDNVLIMPLDQWHGLFDPQAVARPDTVRVQVHARISRGNLPSDPQAAFILATGQGHNFEARAAGSASLSNNLAAKLDASRADALYAEILFLFLGAPGVAAAALLTIAVARSDTAARRHRQALLRLRGASSVVILSISAMEALLVGGVGSVLGIGLGMAAAAALLSAATIALPTLLWCAVAALMGMVLSAAAILLPAWWDAKHFSIVAARFKAERQSRPLWLSAYVDLVVLLVAGLIFWRTAASGYQIILAPEGVAAVAVDYWAFLAPLLFWLGMAMFALRGVRWLLTSARVLVGHLVKPVGRAMTPLIAASLARQPGRLANVTALTALAIAFAASTAIFNATYRSQSSVDAELTNGADITVTGSTANPPGQMVAKFAATEGVKAAVPMQHRFAYVGADLQDLYGIDPATISDATTMADAYFANGDARSTLAALQKTPDGVLLSEETVTDFQLNPNDVINLRLQSAKDQRYYTVPFRFIGVVREFPTAPSDSFIVANADYVARSTGSAAAEVVLIRTKVDPARVMLGITEVAKVLPGATVRDIGSASKLIGTSLTSVDLAGLTRLELVFAIALCVSATALMILLGLLDRRRSFAVMAAVGATRPNILAFLRSEVLVVVGGGLVLGLAVGVSSAWMLVKLLTGVFDPPPETLTVPWLYLVATLIATLVGVGLALWLAERQIERSPVEVLRQS